MADEAKSGEVPRYGEGGGEGASMEKAAQRAQERGPGSAEAPGRTVAGETGAGETGAGEPAPEQAPRQTNGVADRRPSRA